MSDGKIHIPARRKQPVDDQMVVKVTPEAYNALVDIYNESTLSLKQIASLLIVIMYRSIDLRTIKDKDERKRIKKIQEIVALKKKNRRKMTDYEIGEMFA